MKTLTITCQDCSHERETHWANTRYCKVCRLLRNLRFIGKRTQKCWTCDKQYAPLSRNDIMCAKCHGDMPTAGPEGKCGLCGAAGRVIDSDVLVCFECANDPAKRPTLMRAVANKVRQRTAAQSDSSVTAEAPS